MPRNRFRTLDDAQGHVDAMADIVATARPLAELLRAAERVPVDQRTGREMLLLLQCITDMTYQFELDTETVTARFKTWAIGSARPWWELYRLVMADDRHAVKQMFREG